MSQCPASPQVCETTVTTAVPNETFTTTTTVPEPVPAEQLPVTGSETIVLLAFAAVLIAAGGTLLAALRTSKKEPPRKS